jgi:peptide/nickel transport system permease protein
MIRFLLLRSLVSLPILFGVLLVTFVLFHVAGGDPTLVMLGKNAKPRDVEALRSELGLDRPLFWGHWRRTEQIPALDFRQGPGGVAGDGIAWVPEGWLSLEPGAELTLQPAWDEPASAPAGRVRCRFRGCLRVGGQPFQSRGWRTVTIPLPSAPGAVQLRAETVTALRWLRAERSQSNPLDSQFTRVLREIVDLRRDADGRRRLVFLDFGKTLGTGEPVRQVLRAGVGPSAILMGSIFLLELVIALALAMASAHWHDQAPDRVLVVLSVAGMSVSYLVFILFAQYVLAYRLNLFPVWGWDSWRCALLPVLVGVASGLGGSVRYYRTVFLDEIYRDHVRTAVAKGAGPVRVLCRHVLPNALIPILTRVSVVLPFLFTGSLLLESFFGIPGLGYAGVNALANGDVQLLKALVFVSALLFLLANLAADIATACVDPRVRLR